MSELQHSRQCGSQPDANPEQRHSQPDWAAVREMVASGLVTLGGEFALQILDSRAEMYEALRYFHDAPSLSSQVLSHFATICHKALAKAEGRSL